MSAQLLQGPLQVREDGEANFYGLMDVQSGNWFARIQFNGEMMPAQQKAYAYLFANAPAMLEALETGWNLGERPSVEGQPCLCSQCKFVRLRDAAIAKAKGQA